KHIAYVLARDAGNVGGFGSAQANAAWVHTRVLWVADPTGAPAHALTAAGSGIYQPMWSRDSRSLFYVRDNTLWRVGAGGGAPIKVVGPFPTAPQFYPFGYYGHLSWSGQVAWQDS
ncbi:MAG: biopolymer transporter Tol, partial [Chloroflexota bacterium]